MIVVAECLQLLDGSRIFVAVIDRRIGCAIALRKCGIFDADCLLGFFLALWVDFTALDLVSGGAEEEEGGGSPPPPPPPAANAGIIGGAAISTTEKLASVIKRLLF